MDAWPARSAAARASAWRSPPSSPSSRSLCSAPCPPTPSADALSHWSGGIDLYRSGVFTTQKTWLWCTAADVQIIRNIVDHRTDHSRTSQQRYFDYMRAHDRYRIPLKDGVDPAGWAAGLRTTSTGATGSWRAAASTRRCDPRSRTSGRPTGRSGSRSPMATMPGS